MQVKTFKAVDMPEALQMVKSEFGQDAMILSSRRQRRKGLLWRFSKQYVEVTAARDTAPRIEIEPKPERDRNEPNTMDVFQKSMLAPMARELKELRARVETLTAREKGVTAPASPPLQESRKEARVNPYVAALSPHAQLKPKPAQEKPAVEPPARVLPSTEVEELKKVLLRSLEKREDSAKEKTVIRQPEKRPAGDGTNSVALLAGELLTRGVEESAISQLMAPVADAAARGATQDRLRELLKKSIADGISCSGPFKLRKNAARILALVGPTGVGKTTTIAKLAALAYKQGVTVALITIDTFRIGAVAQLQTYSGIMDMPMEIASTPAELAEAIDLHADKQLIFIDTAGRNPRDRNKIQEMKAFLDVDPSIETHLCLSATTRDRELIQAVSRFGALPVSRIIFTKLDESMSFGCIVNTHLRTKLPLSYFTTGQRVPEDIETVTSQRVADLVVREIKA